MKKKSVLLMDIMTKRVITVQSTLSIREIAGVMAREKVSGVAVAGPDGRIVGIIAECDVMRHLLKKDWELLTADEIMTPYVVSIGPETTIEDAADVMKTKCIHRLLVMGGEPLAPIGMVSASDIVKEIGKGSS